MAWIWVASAMVSQLIVGIRCENKPDPVHCGVPSSAKMAPDDMAHYSAWTPQSRQNLWEMSGQLEGDIMVEQGEGRNAILDPARLWPDAILPYYIDTEDFDKDDVKLIRGAMKKIEKRTCVTFRPYKRGDEAYVTVRGDRDGCWSYVGRKDGGQTLNLGDKCVRDGIATHELLHAIGLHHQQSATDRDNYVTVHWDNIESEHKHNFDKYNSSAVTDYGVGYDYQSIMHYSAYAFSKNDKATISAKEDGVDLVQQSTPSEKDVRKDNMAKIGQRKGLSKKDVQKVNAMYKCNRSEPEDDKVRDKNKGKDKDSDQSTSDEMSDLIDLFT